jgi:hypothetical protein
MSIQQEMNELVAGLVSEVTTLAHQAAEMVMATFEGTSTRKRRRGRPPGTCAPKRSSRELEALAEQFASFVNSNPGRSIEQINRELGTTRRRLMLPIRRLIAAGRITTMGERRETTYFPANSTDKT